MCGRFSQALPAELMVRLFRAVDLRREIPAPSWNVAALQSVTAVLWDGEHRRRVLAPLTWGLLAPWEKHWDTARVRPINARSETVAMSKMFAPAFRTRRCLVPVDAWYEWHRAGGGKTPHALARSDRAPAVLGGIWECWRSPRGDRMRTLAIVTMPATPDLTGIHDRMPLLLEEADWPVWLGEAAGDAEALMRPAQSGVVTAWRVGAAVGSPHNNGAQLLEAV